MVCQLLYWQLRRRLSPIYNLDLFISYCRCYQFDSPTAWLDAPFIHAKMKTAFRCTYLSADLDGSALPAKIVRIVAIERNALNQNGAPRPKSSALSMIPGICPQISFQVLT